MNKNKSLVIIVIILTVVLTACTGRESEAAPTAVASQPSATPQPTTPPTATEPLPTATTAPTDTPVPTATNTPPPTDTATPMPSPTLASPIEISEEVAADGCTLVNLNPESWSPLYAAYKSGSDPFFHFHTNEPDFYFNLELYTQYGPGWTGQLGTFAPDCNGNGICVYLVPDATNPYLATDGEVAINSLAETGSVISGTVEIALSNLTLQPVPGTSSPGCFHIEEVTVFIAETE